MVDSVTITLRWLAHGQGLPLPAQQTAGAAGMDVAAALADGEVIEIAPGRVAMIPSGFAIALPEGYEVAFGIALGWEDVNAPINRLRATRADPGEWLDLQGF